MCEKMNKELSTSWNDIVSTFFPTGTRSWVMSCPPIKAQSKLHLHHFFSSSNLIRIYYVCYTTTTLLHNGTHKVLNRYLLNNLTPGTNFILRYGKKKLINIISILSVWNVGLAAYDEQNVMSH